MSQIDSQISTLRLLHTISLDPEKMHRIEALQQEVYDLYCAAYKYAYLESLARLDEIAGSNQFHPWHVIAESISPWQLKTVSADWVGRWRRQCISELITDEKIEVEGPLRYAGSFPRFRLLIP